MIRSHHFLACQMTHQWPVKMQNLSSKVGTISYLLLLFCWSGTDCALLCWAGVQLNSSTHNWLDLCQYRIHVLWRTFPTPTPSTNFPYKSIEQTQLDFCLSNSFSWTSFYYSLISYINIENKYHKSWRNSSGLEAWEVLTNWFHALRKWTDKGSSEVWHLDWSHILNNSYHI